MRNVSVNPANSSPRQLLAHEQQPSTVSVLGRPLVSINRRRSVSGKCQNFSEDAVARRGSRIPQQDVRSALPATGRAGPHAPRHPPVQGGLIDLKSSGTGLSNTPYQHATAQSQEGVRQQFEESSAAMTHQWCAEKSPAASPKPSRSRPSSAFLQSWIQKAKSGPGVESSKAIRLRTSNDLVKLFKNRPRQRIFQQGGDHVSGFRWNVPFQDR